MIMDIHSHTYYSNCGRDNPKDIINAAVNGGIEVFGISDHNYNVGEKLERYKTEILNLKEEYKGKIKLLLGLELATVPNLNFTEPWLLDDFDYCLLEHIDRIDSTVGLDVPEYRKDFKCEFGIAHTDLIDLARIKGLDPLKFLTYFAENNIFWEMNVNYDSVHNYNEHGYVKRFIKSKEEQDIARKSGIKISVAFEGHRVEDYNPKRVIDMCRFLEENNLPMKTFK